MNNIQQQWQDIILKQKAIPPTIERLQKKHDQPKSPRFQFQFHLQRQHFYLTPRELQTVYLILQCKHYQAIAEDCQLSVRTIQFYAKNALKKFGIRTKKELVALFEKNTGLTNQLNKNKRLLDNNINHTSHRPNQLN